MSYLDRESAPLGQDVWTHIDEAVIGAATSQMTARRLLEIDGPHGLGLLAINGPDEEIESDGAASIGISTSYPVPTIRRGFSLPVRSIAAYEQDGVMFNLRSVAEAAIAVAHREDDIIFNGVPDYGIPGLLNLPGSTSVNLEEWSETGRAFNNVMEAVNVLSSQGLLGPYALAVSPPLYNALFRLYPNGGPTEMEQLQMLVTGGIVKSDEVPGGVLVAVGKQFLSIALGQDLMTAFVGPECGGYEFCIMESAVLRVSLPQAVCVLGGA